MSVFTRRPGLRWLVPAGITTMVFGLGAVTTMVTAAADPALPERNAAQLLVDVQNSMVNSLSGTVVERADLGLPSLPSIGGSGSTDLTSLLSGSHTLRVWIAGPDKARVALLGTLGETDIIVNGRDVWIWDSKANSATHQVLPADPGGKSIGSAIPSLVPTNPQEIAERALAAIGQTTVVSTAGTAKVAGRSAYELVLAPRDTESLVAQIRIAIDSEHHVPLRTQVYAKGSDSPGFEAAFTQVTFERPDDAQFRFNPPEGTTIEEPSAAASSPADRAGSAAGTGADRAATRPVVIGTGWTSVLVTRYSGAVDRAAGQQPADSTGPGSAEAGQIASILSSLPKVNGSWGSGHLLSGKLFSVLITEDGRLLAGAVSPERLTTVAADPAAALKETK
ncbi:MAG: DUF2092 domain-containing protein [Micromonosporaceae bacterium]|nr:DUF2092 domain-containing protein [Micromonosporaceae bacterium]